MTQNSKGEYQFRDYTTYKQLNIFYSCQYLMNISILFLWLNVLNVLRRRMHLKIPNQIIIFSNVLYSFTFLEQSDSINFYFYFLFYFIEFIAALILSKKKKRKNLPPGLWQPPWLLCPQPPLLFFSSFLLHFFSFFYLFKGFSSPFSILYFGQLREVEVSFLSCMGFVPHCGGFFVHFVWFFSFASC